MLEITFFYKRSEPTERKNQEKYLKRHQNVQVVDFVCVRKCFGCLIKVRSYTMTQRHSKGY